MFGADPGLNGWMVGAGGREEVSVGLCNHFTVLYCHAVLTPLYSTVTL